MIIAKLNHGLIKNKSVGKRNRLCGRPIFHKVVNRKQTNNVELKKEFLYMQHRDAIFYRMWAFYGAVLKLVVKGEGV